MRTLYLHIGTYKTGSTSLQRWLAENEQRLQDNGYALYRGQHVADNHIELFLASMRYEREAAVKQRMGYETFGPAYTAAVATRVQRFVADCDQRHIVMTTEGLSALRHADELQRLATLVKSSDVKVKVIVYLRNRKDFLDSYRAQMAKHKGRVPSKEYWSTLYVNDDTWLIDYEGLLGAYRQEFGADAVEVIDYDEQMQLRNNVIPSFLESIGLPAAMGGEVDTYRDNRTLSARPRSPTRKLLRSIGKRLGIR